MQNLIKQTTDLKRIKLMDEYMIEIRELSETEIDKTKQSNLAHTSSITLHSTGKAFKVGDSLTFGTILMGYMRKVF